MASNDPIKTMVELQRVWLEAWASGSRQAFDVWRHVFDLQQQLIKNAAEQHRRNIEISDGASFTDKYGKRAHDIDPERDV